MPRQKRKTTKRIRPFKERRIYYFPCRACLKPHRSSHKMARANNGFCRKCRKGMQENVNQMKLFPAPTSECPDHPNGHEFIPCDEWPATCTCGKQEYET